jgi:hypothetical protein
MKNKSLNTIWILALTICSSAAYAGGPIGGERRWVETASEPGATLCHEGAKVLSQVITETSDGQKKSAQGRSAASAAR